MKRKGISGPRNRGVFRNIGAARDGFNTDGPSKK
jgi:hypothetical protein